MGPGDKTPHADRKKTRSQQSVTVVFRDPGALRTPDVRATIVATRLANPLAMRMATRVAAPNVVMRCRFGLCRSAPDQPNGRRGSARFQFRIEFSPRGVSVRLEEHFVTVRKPHSRSCLLVGRRGTPRGSGVSPPRQPFSHANGYRCRRPKLLARSFRPVPRSRTATMPTTNRPRG